VTAIPDIWFQQALDRIRPHIVTTPLTRDRDRGLFLKWENHQVTGSFKARGALNKVLALEEWERRAGLVAASAGNHGQGVALAAQLTGTTAEIYVPSDAVPAKVDAVRQLGGVLSFIGGGYGDVEAAAKKYAREAGKTFISPYNDAQIIAGQGTIALEVAKQLEAQYGVSARDLGAWVLPVGGGGLICGCAAALKTLGVGPTMRGVQPAASAFTFNLFHRGSQAGVEDNPTLADGLSGAIDEESITIPLMREFVDDIATVEEADIERAISLAWSTYGEKLEGSAAAALADALSGKIKDGPWVVVLTGGNIQPQTLDDVLARRPVQAQQ
jgi:threonine dehydratase